MIETDLTEEAGKKVRGSLLRVEMTPYELTEFAKAYNRENSHARNYDEPDFCKLDWQKSVELLERGWPEGSRKIETKVGQILTALGDREGFGIERDITGDYLDVADFLSGEPECFHKIVLQERPEQEVEVHVNISYSCGVKKECVFNRGAVITAVLDELRKHYFVRVVVHMGGRDFSGSQKWDNIDFRIHFDTSNLYSRSFFAFMCANEAVLRRLDFSLVEHYEDKDYISGYGMPFSFTKKTDIPENAVLFDEIRNNSNWDSIEKAKDQLKSVLKKHNITLEGVPA